MPWQFLLMGWKSSCFFFCSFLLYFLGASLYSTYSMPLSQLPLPCRVSMQCNRRRRPVAPTAQVNDDAAMKETGKKIRKSFSPRTNSCVCLSTTLVNRSSPRDPGPRLFGPCATTPQKRSCATFLSDFFFIITIFFSFCRGHPFFVVPLRY